jgi:hypothetical protein
VRQTYHHRDRHLGTAVLIDAAFFNATHEGKVVFFFVDLWQCMVDIDIFWAPLPCFVLANS